MSQVEEFHYCVGICPGIPSALPFSVADCPHCTEADYPPSIADQLERHRAFVRALVAKSDRGICPVCSYLWRECTCGIGAADHG